ncbi:MAG TPA: cellulase family glycosylhydrolase [Armatimonadota bacterium]|jgi:aryl-phospho-beta-D-glucosidase BglC (GH1 family)
MLKLIFAAAIAAMPVASRSEATPLPRLRTDGIKIVTPAGDEVRLAGINLGGWFVQEMWMTPWVQDPPDGSPYHKVNDDAGLWRVLGERLGPTAMQDIKTAWRNAWIQREDFKRIKSAGFNSVRIPFLFDIVDEPKGMDWLRKSVAWANENGLYAVLDMHGTPGRQSADHTTGEAGVNKFFYEPKYVEQAENIWTKIAREFGRNPGVAAFDLINEPTGAPNPATLHLVYNRLYQAVRKAAPDTIVIVDDGYKGFDTTPHANVAGWANMVYSLHFYNFDAKSSDEQIKSLAGRLPKTLELRGYRNAPVYIGEFNIEPHSSPETMSEYLQTLNGNGFSWAVWTYKTVARGGPMGYWGLYSKPDAANAINPFTDTVAEMKAKIEQVRTENLSPVQELLAVYQASANPAPPKRQK